MNTVCIHCKTPLPKDETICIRCNTKQTTPHDMVVRARRINQLFVIFSATVLGVFSALIITSIIITIVLLTTPK